MQDQVEKLNGIGIDAVFLGSAQIDKQAETHALEFSSKTNLMFVTPEWMAKPFGQAKLQALAGVNQLSLIAIDEAHLYTDWCSFRSTFTDLKNLKYNFPDTPVMALTATANSVVEDEIKILLRHPVIQKASMNRPNIALNVEELGSDKSVSPAMQFGIELRRLWDHLLPLCILTSLLTLAQLSVHCQKMGFKQWGTMERWMLTPDMSLICSGSQGKPRQ